MSRFIAVLAVSGLAALALNAGSAYAASIPANIATAVADSNRPDADKQRDADRKPAETLAFIGVKEGEQVAELLPGGGYFTRILSKAVGVPGKVYAVVPPRAANAPADRPDPIVRLKPITDDQNYSNVSVVQQPLATLSVHAPRSSAAGSLTTISVIGLLLGAAACVVFLVLQRHGHRLAERLAARLLPAAVATTAAVGAELDAIYRSPARVALSAALHLAAWLASAFGIWIAFRLIGARVDIASVIAIESLICAVRSAAVAVPHALGVQEAAYTVIAPLFGVGAEFGLAVSLLKRARDIAVGIPILLIWQAVEGRRAMA